MPATARRRCNENGYEPTEDRVDRLFNAAKESNRVLPDETLKELAEQPA